MTSVCPPHQNLIKFLTVGQPAGSKLSQKADVFEAEGEKTH